MDSRTLYDSRAVPLNVGHNLNGRYGRSHIPNIGRETRKEDIGKGNKKSHPNEEEMAVARLSGIPDTAIKLIFRFLEPLPCYSVAFAIAHPRFYTIRKANYQPIKDLYTFDPPVTIRTPTQLLYVTIKDFMGSDRHFCYTRRKFIPWIRQGMTIDEKKRDRCPEDTTPKSCRLCCGDKVGPLHPN